MPRRPYGRSRFSVSHRLDVGELNWQADKEVVFRDGFQARLHHHAEKSLLFQPCRLANFLGQFQAIVVRTKISSRTFFGFHSFCFLVFSLSFSFGASVFYRKEKFVARCCLLTISDVK